MTALAARFVYTLAHPMSGLWADAPPDLWRTGHFKTIELDAVTSATRGLTGPHSTLAFRYTPETKSAFAFAWAAYLLPERNVVDLRDVPDLQGVDFVLCDKTSWYHPRLALLRRLPVGWLLFRVNGSHWDAKPEPTEAPAR